MNLLSILEYGTAAEDPEAIQFADRGFKYAMSQGECLLGFFGEWLNMSTPQTLETCTLADMIALAIKLTLAGTGDYWDMVDRWTRNLFAEGQLTSAHRAHWLASRTATTPVAPMQLPPFHTSDQVIEKNIGGFGYSLAPNDFVSRYPYGAHNPALGIIHCCTGNGARTIYYLWENILAFTEGRLQINLLLNRASKWADVDSHIPYTGQVDVTVKQPVAAFDENPRMGDAGAGYLHGQRTAPQPRLGGAIRPGWGCRERGCRDALFPDHRNGRNHRCRKTHLPRPAAGQHVRGH